MYASELLNWNMALSAAHGIVHEALVWLFMACLGMGALCSWIDGRLEAV